MGFLTKYKKGFLITGIVICFLAIGFTAAYKQKPTFIENILGYIITPMQKYVGGAGKWVKDQFAFFGEMKNLRSENEHLKDQMAELEAERGRLLLIEQQNIELSKLLKITQKYPQYAVVGAEIIGKDPGNWYDNFVIDKGMADGLSKNMVVMASGGVVGRIMASGSTYSKVKSLIDDSSAISGESVRTGDTGIVKGDMRLMSEGLCRMEYIDASAQIVEGDEIVTSNLGEIYPPGLSIGYVTEVRQDANGLTKYAIIKPSVDFKHLETVLVIPELFTKKSEQGEEQ